MPEKCQRCGEIAEDRRTLWMACLYAMHELDVPFEQCAVHGQYLKKTGEEKANYGGPDLSFTVFEEPKDDAELHRYPLYTLRVCKSCRADWMSAIEEWFKNPPESEVDDPEANIPIRVQGATKMVTREEFDKIQEKQ